MMQSGRGEKLVALVTGEGNPGLRVENCGRGLLKARQGKNRGRKTEGVAIDSSDRSSLGF